MPSEEYQARPWATSTKNVVKFTRTVFKLCVRTDRPQTDGLITILATVMRQTNKNENIAQHCQSYWKIIMFHKRSLPLDKLQCCTCLCRIFNVKYKEATKQQSHSNKWCRHWWTDISAVNYKSECCRLVEFISYTPDMHVYYTASNATVHLSAAASHCIRISSVCHSQDSGCTRDSCLKHKTYSLTRTVHTLETTSKQQTNKTLALPFFVLSAHSQWYWW